MSNQYDNGRPIYAQLVDSVARSIVAGEYSPGDKFPGVREMAMAAGVNPNTMQRALAELETQGLVYTQRTSGRYVTGDVGRIRSQRDQLALNVATEFIQSMQALGCTPDEIAGYVKQAREELQ